MVFFSQKSAFIVNDVRDAAVPSSIDQVAQVHVTWHSTESPPLYTQQPEVGAFRLANQQGSRDRSDDAESGASDHQGPGVCDVKPGERNSATRREKNVK